MDTIEITKELKEIQTHLSDIKITLARNTDSLDYHVRRTDLLEKKLDAVEKDVLKVRGFFSIGGWIVAIAATLITVLTKAGALLK